MAHVWIIRDRAAGSSQRTRKDFIADHPGPTHTNGRENLKSLIDHVSGVQLKNWTRKR